jgi:hypothetical protein
MVVENRNPSREYHETVFLARCDRVGATNYCSDAGGSDRTVHRVARNGFGEEGRSLNFSIRERKHTYFAADPYYVMRLPLIVNYAQPQ